MCVCVCACVCFTAEWGCGVVVQEKKPGRMKLQGPVTKKTQPVIIVNFLVGLNTNPEKCQFLYLNYSPPVTTAYLVICQHFNSE